MINYQIKGVGMKRDRLVVVEKLANRLMRKFGVADRFEFSFMDLTDYCGQCFDPWNGQPGKIRLSVHYVRLNPLKMIEDSIRHEIAHAMVGCNRQNDGHDDAWIAACRVTGARPEPFAENAKMP